MQFNSLEYLIFLPLVVGAYFAIPFRFRWALLLAASYYFYMAWRPEYAVLMAGSTLVDYGVGLRMGRVPKPARKKYLAVSLAANLTLLGVFKYFNLFNETVRAAFAQINVLYDVPALDVLLPVGISFYTFQAISYTIDVYRGDIQPERHLGRFALYVSFFPQLVAGPIERSTRLLPQFRERHQWQPHRAVSGLQLIGFGLFKKVVIADPAGTYVAAVYSAPHEFQGLPLIIATYFFAFQIYCDFSAYSDIAIGSARLMGYELMQNFRRPYLATSVADFWRRWHISLSTWFRDYVYLPLGGNRVAPAQWAANVMLVFMLSGLWHGANWTFLAWGTLHGLFLIVGRFTADARRRAATALGLDRAPRIYAWMQILTTFHLLLVSWILFRAQTIGDAVLIMRNMFTVQGFDVRSPQINVAPGMGREEMIVAALAIALLLAVHALEERRRPWPELLSSRRPAVRWAVYVTAVLAILNLGLPQELPFIYFQF